MAAINKSQGHGSVRIPWDRLRVWIDEQEVREQQAPGSLTGEQLKAISMLIPIVDEPWISDRDYVSELMQYLQGLQLGLPTFTYSDAAHVPTDGAFQLRWSCVCTLACCKGEFPRQGYRFNGSTDNPIFQSKKSAKQYAAKQALKFLQSRAENGADSEPRTAPAKRPLSYDSGIVEAVTADTGAADDSPADNGAPLLQASEPKRPRESDESSPSVHEQISSIANELDLGNFSYTIEPDVGQADLFSGRPLFTSPNTMPPELGVVHGVHSKKRAKLQIAEKVLDWLKAERERRNADFNAALLKSSQSPL